MARAKSWFENNTSIGVFLFTVSYVLLVGLVLTLVIIPLFFQSWNAGEGILVSSKDTSSFHLDASALAEQIRSQGWQVWDLRPSGNSPVGIAAAIYAIFGSSFWFLLPFNALVHGLGAAMIWSIFRDISGRHWIASIASSPFIFFPSSLQWTAQWHKDGLSIVGFYLYARGWNLLLNKWKRQKSVLEMVGIVTLIFLGVVLAWISRPELFALLEIISMFPMGFMVYKLIQPHLRKGGVPILQPGSRFFAGIVAILILISFDSILSNEASFINTKSALGALTTSSAEEVGWQSSTAIPPQIDNLMHSISNRRDRYLINCATALSCEDAEISFSSSMDVISYFPRATILAFLAPFPSAWFEQGISNPTTLFRRIVGFEMIITYMALPGLLFAIWFSKEPEVLLTVLLLAYFWVLPFALIVPNIGTLYRLRYGGLMLFVGTGLCGYFMWRERTAK